MDNIAATVNAMKISDKLGSGAPSPLAGNVATSAIVNTILEHCIWMNNTSRLTSIKSLVLKESVV